MEPRKAEQIRAELAAAGRKMAELHSLMVYTRMVKRMGVRIPTIYRDALAGEQM